MAVSGRMKKLFRDGDGAREPEPADRVEDRKGSTESKTSSSGSAPEARDKDTSGGRDKSTPPQSEKKGGSASEREPKGEGEGKEPDAVGGYAEGGEVGDRGMIHERHAEERKRMHEAHERERRDMHGNHRQEHRDMHTRHEKAHKEMAARQDEELAGQNPAMPEGAGPEMGTAGPSPQGQALEPGPAGQPQQ